MIRRPIISSPPRHQLTFRFREGKVRCASLLLLVKAPSATELSTLLSVCHKANTSGHTFVSTEPSSPRASIRALGRTAPALLASSLRNRVASMDFRRRIYLSTASRRSDRCRPEQEGMVEYALKVCDQYQSFAASVRTGQSRLSMTHPHRAQWKRILFLRGGVAPT